ncbi:MAG TPA: SDR family oxidoreductase [Micromonosporaceae bacterium]|jgi:NAD(P)-dependent dehydrogenase (short-subunit alcohol dehydrogenase family)
MATTLVTGGASGLGRAIVDRLLTAGEHPAVLDLKPPSQDVPYQAVDLADARAAEAAVRVLAEQTGGLHAVVTAAGIDHPGALSDVDAQDWERVIAVNLVGTAAVIRAALPYLIRERGHVVTVASTLGLRALSDATAYCAAKFGVVGLTRALSAELGASVGVSLLIPGGMRTAFFDGRDERYRPGADASLNDPVHVADAVLFALRQPPGCAVRELVICPSTEPSYP